MYRVVVFILAFVYVESHFDCHHNHHSGRHGFHNHGMFNSRIAGYRFENIARNIIEAYKLEKRSCIEGITYDEIIGSSFYQLTIYSPPLVKESIKLKTKFLVMYVHGNRQSDQGRDQGPFEFVKILPNIIDTNQASWSIVGNNIIYTAQIRELTGLTCASINITENVIETNPITSVDIIVKDSFTTEINALDNTLV